MLLRGLKVGGRDRQSPHLLHVWSKLTDVGAGNLLPPVHQKLKPGVPIIVRKSNCQVQREPRFPQRAVDNPEMTAFAQLRLYCRPRSIPHERGFQLAERAPSLSIYLYCVSFSSYPHVSVAPCPHLLHSKFSGCSSSLSQLLVPVQSSNLSSPGHWLLFLSALDP